MPRLIDDPDLGRDAHAFVLRIRVEPFRGADEASPRIRLEHVNTHDTSQFTDIDKALVHLRTCLERVVVGPAG